MIFWNEIPDLQITNYFFVRCFVDTSRYLHEILETALEEVTFAECVEFHKTMWQDVSVKGLSFGNISQEMTLDFVNRCCEALKCKFAAFPPQQPSVMLRKEQPHHTIYSLKTQNPGKMNSRKNIPH